MNRMLKYYYASFKMLIMFSCVAIITIGCSFMTGIYEDEPESKPVVVAADSSNIISPEDFSVLISGKTKKEVREVMGRTPDHVMDLGEGMSIWTYMKKITANGKYIHDPDVGKNVSSVNVTFENGKAEKPSLSYY